MGSKSSLVARFSLFVDCCSGFTIDFLSISPGVLASCFIASYTFFRHLDARRDLSGILNRFLASARNDNLPTPAPPERGISAVTLIYKL